MRMSIVGLTVLLAFANQAAFGQAGSVGGIIGKTDKSVSGDQEQQPVGRERRTSPPTAESGPAAARARKPQAKTQATEEDTTQSGKSACGNIVGTWSWPNGGVMAFYKNGGAGAAGQPPGGTWRCSGSTVIAVFNNGGRDQYVVGPDGNSLSLTTNWLPGTYTATRKH
jgi:hypothetical protein